MLTKKNSIELIIIRHAEARANIEGLVTGGSEDELTPFGEQQAIDLGKFFGKQIEGMPCTILTSSMKRAIDTFKLMNLKQSFETHSGLNEHDGGSVSYMTRCEFDKEYKNFWEPFDPDRAFPDGESHSELYHRINTTIDEIIAKCETEKLLIVAHSGTISSIMHRFFDIPLYLYSRFKAENCSITSLTIDKDYKVYPILNYFNRQYIK